ncbi:hypothetical protein [Sporosarcina sp. FA15]|uniref:hypothetical protein n=1 Tax=Sporosarcina sp. FA15 TaxID=3413031 RepID=UPI003F6576B2
MGYPLVVFVSSKTRDNYSKNQQLPLKDENSIEKKMEIEKMRIELDMPQGLEIQLKELMLTSMKEAIEQHKNSQLTKNWMSLKEGALYAGVSYTTFMKFRTMGLKVCEIDGVKRVSKKEINSFLETNSY